MLTAKENMRQCIIGGKPDRYVNQFEAISMVFDPSMLMSPMPKKGGEPTVNAWGVTYSFPNTAPAAFPVHTPDKIVVKDIEHWQDYVHAPDLTKIPDNLWDMCKGMYDAVDGNLSYKAAFVAPGLFEQCHHLCEIQNALIYYLEYPDEMHDLIKYLTEYELKQAELTCSRLHPDAVFHHDDWGSERNSFLRPSVVEDFFLDAYKEIDKYYHDHGVEFIFHHCDCYAANLIPYMIEMGIDVWQGCMHSNNVPDLVKQYQGKITFMGEIDNKFVDFEGWTPADCEKVGYDAIERVGSMTSFIPCITQGGAGSLYPGAYDALFEGIDKYNIEHFGCTKEELTANRVPQRIMF